MSALAVCPPRSAMFAQRFVVSVGAVVLGLLFFANKPNVGSGHLEYLEQTEHIAPDNTRIRE